MNCDPKSLVAAARCYACVPKPMQRAVLIYLLLSWATIKSIPKTHVLISGSGSTGANQTYSKFSDAEYDGTGGFKLLLTAGVWAIHQGISGNLYTISAASFPAGTWTKVNGSLPLPTGKYV